MSVVGPFEATRMTARMWQWVREWFVGAIREAGHSVDADKVLDFSNFLSLIEAEFSPDGSSQRSNALSPLYHWSLLPPGLMPFPPEQDVPDNTGGQMA
jgi:hypothetical protein